MIKFEDLKFMSIGCNCAMIGCIKKEDRLKGPVDNIAIKSFTGFKLVLDNKLFEFVKNANYPVAATTLGDNEYFVCGDNRDHSSDSRAEGPVKKEWITGKVIGLCGTATVYQDGAYYDIKDIKYTWPRYL